MPIPTDTYWNVKKLNVVFAVSSVALLGTMVWSVIQDYDKFWREPQRSARVWEAALTEEKIERPLSPEDRQWLAQADALLPVLSERMRRKQDEIDKKEEAIRKQQSEIEMLQRKHNDLKAEANVDEVNLEIARTTGNLEEAKRLEQRLAGPRKEIREDAEKLAAMKGQLDERKKERKELSGDFDAIKKERDKLAADREALVKKRDSLEPQTLLAHLSAQIRATPLLQFVNPMEKPQHVVLTDVLAEMPPLKVPVVDRCITCHVNIGKKDFTEENMLAFLERTLAEARGIKYPEPPAEPDATFPTAIAKDPGAVAMAEFWHAWGKTLLPAGAWSSKSGDQRSPDELLNEIVAGAGAYVKPPVNRSVVAAAEAAAQNPALLSAADREKRDAVEDVKRLLNQLYSNYDAVLDACARATGGDREAARAKLDPVRKAALLYPQRLRQVLEAHLKPEAERLLNDRYRRALVAQVNQVRDEQGRSPLDDSRVMLAHPNLDLYVSADSKHPLEGGEKTIGMGCSVCHDGSGQETNFVLAAHTPRDLWVDSKTGAPLFPVQLTGKVDAGDHGHSDKPAMANMLEAVFPETDLIPKRVSSVLMNLAGGEGHHGGAAGNGSHGINGSHHDASRVETAPEHVDAPVEYVDPLRPEKKGKAVPQFQYWQDKYEHEAGRSFKLVYHEWDWPMRKHEYLQANCARCHTKINDISYEAPVLAEGKALFTNLGCVNCHQMDSIPVREKRQVGPDLRHVKEKLSPEFINTWVFAPKSFRPTTRMPHFFLLENNSSDEEIRRTRQEARAITEYLLRTSTPLPPKHKPPGEVKGDPESGKKIFKAIGCLACHQNLNLPADDPSNPGSELADLSVGEQWITTDLIKKGELAERLRARIEADVTRKLTAELPEKVKADVLAAAEAELRDPIEQRITEEVTAEKAPKNPDGTPKRLSTQERSRLRREIAPEVKKRVDAEWEKVKAEQLPRKLEEANARIPAALAEAQRALPGVVAEQVTSALAEATAAEAKKLYQGMTYNERQVYVLENLEAPTVLTPETLPRYPDGTPKPLFIHHGPELSGIGTKLLDHRSPEQARAWLFDWLKEPRHYSSYTVMPNLRLSDQQAMDLVEHLLAQKRDAQKTVVAHGEQTREVPDAWQSGLPPVDSSKLVELTAFFLRSRFSIDTALRKADEPNELKQLASAALVRPGVDKPAAAAMVEQVISEEVAAQRNPNDTLRMIYLGQKLISHYGCMSCHAINGAENLTSPCANLSDWGQKQVSKLDFAYLDHHRVHSSPPPAKVPMVNGVSAEASKLAFDPSFKPSREGEKQRVLELGWQAVDHRRENWLMQKLLNTRIYDRGKVLLEPEPGATEPNGTLASPGKPYDKLRMPTFYMNDEQAKAIVTFVLSNRDKLVSERMLVRTNGQESDRIAYGRFLAQKYNCVSCHQLEWTQRGGNTPHVQQYYAPSDLAVKAPPSLRGEGSKIDAGWLSRFLWNVEPLRPMLQPSGGIRMPSFPFDDKGEEVEALAAYFAAASNKESEQLKAWVEPVVKWHESAADRAKKAAERAALLAPMTQPAAPPGNGGAEGAGGPPAIDPVTVNRPPTTHPAGMPPAQGGAAVAGAVGQQLPLLAKPPGPAFGPDSVMIPVDDWFKEPTLAQNAAELQRWGLETGQLKPIEFNPFNNTPQQLATAYATALYKARFVSGLYQAPYPFPVEGTQEPMSDAEFKKGEQLFRTLDCTKCHTLQPPGEAEYQPPPSGVTAPNLSRAHQRLQRRWVRHWVQEPPALQPGTAMPPFFTGLPLLKLDGISWPRTIPAPDPSQQPQYQQYMDHARQFEQTFGESADEQTRLLIRFVYAAGQRGYVAPRTGEGAPQPPAVGVSPTPAQPQGGGTPAVGSPAAAPVGKVPTTGAMTPTDAKPAQPAVTPPPAEAKPAPTDPKPADPKPADAKPGDAKPQPAAQPGEENIAVSGLVKFKGTPPPRGVIQAVMQNPQCAQLHKQPVPDDSLVVSPDGAIQNAVVYVSAGLPAGKQWPVPGESVKLDQKGCRYDPHVVSMMVGQKLEAANSDAFLHNVHTLPAKNPETNLAQPGIDAGQPLKPVKVAEKFRVKCDVHPWMSAWVVAVDHPFHSVTGDDGFFALSSLPPGKYTLTAWHETLGEQTKQVTVKEGEPAEVEFTFEKK